MHIFLYQPNQTMSEGWTKRFEADGVKCSIVDETFFHPETVRAVASSITTTAILMADVPDSVEYIENLRNNNCLSPIIAILGAKDSRRTTDLINAGADDVMLVPMKTMEVKSRINAIIRRSYGHVAASVRIGDVFAYFDGRDPEVNGERIRLSGREHAIFSYLALQPGRVISKEQIYEAVYGLMDNQPFAKVIDVYICKIRKKLEEATGRRYIETVYGRGYKLASPNQETSQPVNSESTLQGRNSAAFVGTMRNQHRLSSAA